MKVIDRITKYEWQILSLFLAAALAKTIPTPPLFYVVFYGLGMTFELVTHRIWKYHPSLRESPLSPFPIGANLMFGLGWVAVVVLGLSLGAVFGRHMPGLLADVLGVLIVGNILETVFFVLGLYAYEEASPWLKFPLPYLGRFVTLAGVPLSVRIGYVNSGLLMHFVYQWVIARGSS